MKKKTRCYIYTRVWIIWMLQIFITIKISDLQRRLDTQYDKIDEVEEAIADLKSRVYELKKNQIDAEKKQFMQAFIELIDIFTERREDGN